jgi:hypothetical protein
VSSSATSIVLFGRRYAHEEGWRTAVSLHAHTRHSKENLGFVHGCAGRIPVVSRFYRQERNRYLRYQRKALDFRRAYWTPPLPARKVYESERDRIHDSLGIEALVSLTDHDEAPQTLSPQYSDSWQKMPISLEWTVPISPNLFHLGVHNVPFALSRTIVKGLMSYTNSPGEGDLDQLLDWINEHPETLVVLNHPLSDLKPVGREALKKSVGKFLSRYRGKVHALEINGYRTWEENRATMALAERFQLPLISGGDRHGCACNAVLNLTSAESFSEFAAEIRHDRISRIIIMPEYRNKSLLVRKMETVADFFRDYPQCPHGRQPWTDRVFFQLEDGAVRPLSFYWQRTVPMWVKSVMWIIRLVGLQYAREILRIVLARKREDVSF